MQKTTNYSLPQWEATDALKRSDFNEGMETIDAGLAAANSTAASAVSSVNNLFEFGTIDMTGKTNGDLLKTFSFTPKVVLIWAEQTNMAATSGNLFSAKIQKVGGSGDSTFYLLNKQFKLSGTNSGPSEISYMALR